MSSRLSKCEIQVLTVAHTHAFICTPVQYLFPVFPDPLLTVALLQRETVFDTLMQPLRICFSSVVGDCSEMEALGSGTSRGSPAGLLSSGSIKASCKRPGGLESSRATSTLHFLNVSSVVLMKSNETPYSFLISVFISHPCDAGNGFKCLVSSENVAHPQVPQAELCKYLEMFCHVYMLMI